jgi:2-methylcitrate dehydratase PrpD
MSVADAALANGCIAHALDYDDCGVKIGHPSVLVLPAALSMADHFGSSGQDLLTAYILGLEIEGKLALHADFKLMQSRLNHQSWYGAIGAAAACSKLLRLDVSGTRHALGLAANFACGLAANHGSMAGSMAAGNACRNGVVSAQMAQAGVTANSKIIETRNGFYDTLVGAGHYDAERMAASLGKPFYLESPGIGLKKYPSCYHTHRALDGMFQLLEQHRLKDDDIVEVDVGTSERAMRVLAFSDPATPYQAKYSMPYCIAAAAVDHAVTLETFTDRKFKDPRIAEARKKVHLSFPDLPIWPGLADVGPGTEFVGNPVTIRTRDSRAFDARVDIPRGDPSLPLTDEELIGKYRDCARIQLKAKDIDRSLELILGLERMNAVGPIASTLGQLSRAD